MLRGANNDHLEFNESDVVVCRSKGSPGQNDLHPHAAKLCRPWGESFQLRPEQRVLKDQRRCATLHGIHQLFMMVPER